MDIAELIKHPEQMNRDTLYELRSMLALYPYFQTVRLLMLQNLYLLHDPSFDEELRRAAIYITDRKVIFNMIEAGHYHISSHITEDTAQEEQRQDRTESLIDRFLDSIPKDEEEESSKKRRPTPADATVDYVAYLLESESENNPQAALPQMKGQNLIDSFLENEQGKISLSEEPEFTPEAEDTGNEDTEGADEGYFTETLARIYIKQGRYQKALEIIQRLSTNHPDKNVYFADQIRFLEKLIINNNKSNNKK